MITEFTGTPPGWNLFEIHFDDTARRTALRVVATKPYFYVHTYIYPLSFSFFPLRFIPLLAARARVWNVKNFNVHLYVHEIVWNRWQVPMNIYHTDEYTRTIPWTRLIRRHEEAAAAATRETARGFSRGCGYIKIRPGALCFRAVRDYREGYGSRTFGSFEGERNARSCIAARPPK